jgi:hypothetical protein
MTDTTLDPYTAFLLSQEHAATLGEQEPGRLCQKIAAETLTLTNPRAWREIRSRLTAAGLRGPQLAQARDETWASRKQLKAAVTHPKCCDAVAT